MEPLSTMPRESDDENNDDRTTIIDTNVDSKHRTPEERASIFSIAIVGWLSSLFTIGHKRALEMTDLNYLKSTDHSNNLLTKFNKAWKQQQQRTPHNESASIYKAVRSAFGIKMYTALPFYLLYQIAQFAAPVILGLYLSSIDDAESQQKDRYILSAALFASFMIATFLIIHYWSRVFTVGMQCRGALVAACYEKALKLTMSARGERSTGEIINLITSDCRKIRDVTQTAWVVFVAPLQLIIAVYLLYQHIGWSVFVAIGAQILLVAPLQMKIGTKMKNSQKELLKLKDKRLKMINELFGAMKIVKMYAWEQSFEDNVSKLRANELKVLKRVSWLQFAMTLFFTFAPPLITVISFAVYTLVIGKELTATKAFTSIALFNILRFPLIMLPMTIVSIIEANVSFKRIATFLNAAEIDAYIIEYNTNKKDQYNNNTDGGTDNGKQNAIAIRNAQFAWDDAMNIIALNNINIEFKAGDITMIIGETGSGKSTLLAACLGQINKIDGSLMYYESPFDENEAISVSFSSQIAWIQNATVRENILFGKQYEEDWYNQVVRCCALLSDFEQFDDGDLTEIGERGINLSGGQKQRISLARSVYSNTDCYLFDDPLSAVDPHVANFIMNECFVHLLKNNGKTVILSTHAVSVLKRADKIIVMEQGTIKIQGSLQELMDADVNLTKFIITSKDEAKEEEEEEEEDIETRMLKRRRSSSGFLIKDPEKKEIKVKKSDQGQLTKDEERGEGDIGWSTFKLYFVGIGCCIILMIFCNAVLIQVFQVCSTFWLAIWAEDTYDKSVAFYIQIYFMIQFASLFATFIQYIFVVITQLRASKQLHDSLLIHVMHAPMSFFDSTPIGRIINRFSKDLNNIDASIPSGFRRFLSTTLWALGSIVAVSVVSWYFALVIIPLAWAYYKLQKYFISTTRELRRLSALMNSPIYSHFNETLDGIHIIQSFKKCNAFCTDNRSLIDADHETYYPSFMANRWLSVRLECIANIAVGLAVFLCTITKVSAGLAGVALSSVSTVTAVLNFIVRTKAQLEQDAVSIERLAQYNDINQEAPFVIKETRPNDEWPQYGTIEINDVFMKYRENLNYVLKGVSCRIEGGEKIGCIGRTGAGKSSLFVTLLRICEYDKGEIKIDGIDIKSIGLYDLRSRISVIPQDPVLFIGTVRYNLDPFEQSTDDELIQALKLSHVYEGLRKMAIEADIKRELRELREEKKRRKSAKHVKNEKLSTMKQVRYINENGNENEIEESSSISSSFSSTLTSRSSVHAAEFLNDPKYKDVNPLDIIVDENGSNFSVGQRQLLCLARAIIRKSKIILLDEATSAVDHYTDQLIQETIRDVFNNDTILTIAHRIETVMDYDKIMILDKGKVLEFDSPNNLLSNQQSKFRSIVTESFGVNVEDVLNTKRYLSHNDSDNQ